MDGSVPRDGEMRRKASVGKLLNGKGESQERGYPSCEGASFSFALPSTPRGQDRLKHAHPVDPSTHHGRRVPAHGPRPPGLELMALVELERDRVQGPEVGGELTEVLASILQLRELEAAQCQAEKAGQAHLGGDRLVRDLDFGLLHDSVILTAKLGKQAPDILLRGSKGWRGGGCYKGGVGFHEKAGEGECMQGS